MRRVLSTFLGASTAMVDLSPSSITATSMSSSLSEGRRFIAKPQKTGRNLNTSPMRDSNLDVKAARQYEPTAPEDMGKRPWVSESPAPEDTDKDTHIPGDSFGLINQTRTPFYRPVERQGHFVGELARLMPPDQQPELCVSPAMINYFASRYNLSTEKAYEVLVVNDLDTNRAAQELQEEGIIPPKPLHGPFGVVAMESYQPECVCLCHLMLPSYEATRDPEVLDVIHELVMSAAEIPLDIPRGKVLDKFINEWTVEDETSVKELLKEYNLTCVDILHLPWGEYAAQGFYIGNPVHEDYPNIGTAAAAVALDFKAGIHNRFRFHVERIADSVSEHMVKEALHFNTPQHILRQPFWWEPTSSVESYLRFKEALLQPSALIYEMRTAIMTHGTGFQAYRNIVEMEKLKVTQHKYDSNHQENPLPSKGFTSDGMRQHASLTGATSPGAGLQTSGNNTSGEQFLEDRVGFERDTFDGLEVTANHGRRWAKFYQNNTY